MERENHYEKVKEYWREKFLEMDQEQLAEKFGLKADAQNLYLTYFSQELAIDRHSGEISFVHRPGLAPSWNTVLTIYNVFYYATDHPKASGRLVPFREVKRVYPFEQAYKNTILKPLAAVFSGQPEKLRLACEKMKGTPLPQGDVGYRIPAFPFLNLAVFFWDADEEFPAQANLLFDSEITEFMHEENVVGIASDALFFLTLLAGLSPKEA